MHAQAATEIVSELPRHEPTVSSGMSTSDSLLPEVENTMADLLAPSAGLNPSTAHKAANYHIASGGQRIRARLALHVALSMKLSAHDAVAVASVVELIHNASLVHDDIHDKALERRGQKAVWAIYGHNVAICAGDLLLSAGYAALTSMSDVTKLPKLLTLVHTCVSTLVHGQCSEHSATAITPSFDDYKAVASAKSGALLRLPFELVFTAADRADCIEPAVAAANAFAVGYQILDDLADVESDSNRGEAATCANAVLVLRANGAGDKAEQVAFEAAMAHLSSATAIAGSLPHASGFLLKSMALQLASRT